MLLTFPGSNRTRHHLLLRQSMRAWNDCLPLEPSDWLDTECGRVLLRSMSLDWFCDSSRGGREWLGAVGLGLDTWREATGKQTALVDLPGTAGVIGVVNGFPKIRPSMRAEDEVVDEPVIRLGMQQWEDAILRISSEDIDCLAGQAHNLSSIPVIERVVEQNLELKLPASMVVASVAIMGLVVMKVVGLDQLAIVGGNRAEPWHGYLGQAPANAPKS